MFIFLESISVTQVRKRNMKLSGVHLILWSDGKEIIKKDHSRQNVI
jgi:hypothetical protein